MSFGGMTKLIKNERMDLQNGASARTNDRVEARVLAWTMKRKSADGSTHWSSCKLAAEMGGLSHTTVARI